MEIACPRCDTLFAADPRAVAAYRGRVQCGRCELVFDAPRPAPQRRRHPVLLTLLAVLVLALMLQGAWWGRGYLAAWSPALRAGTAQFARLLGLPFQWPQDFTLLHVRAVHWESPPPLPGMLAGKLANNADFVQAFPYLKLLLTDNQGRVVDQILFAPEDYLEQPGQARLGIAPHTAVSFMLIVKSAARISGYQILPAAI